MHKLIAQERALSELAVRRWRDSQFNDATDYVAEEVPIALEYNGISHVVMLATPQDLEDFALGFSLTEGILQNKHELYEIEIQPRENGIALSLSIASERFAHLKEYRRSMAGRTGCGLCGAESLGQVFRLPANTAPQKEMQKVSAQTIFSACQQMLGLQALQQATGATHACAWVDENGLVGLVREDVGRHNAMDKLIGALASQGRSGGFIITTSRASYEMVQKVAMAGFDLLAAISAPTGLAVRIAESMHITLLGFVRDQQLVAYSHVDRIT
ncbi:MAG: formate dehydrogenase accessory sulfurtransferase FdhD [Methylophilus sp.]|nr:formate dehydrogenase accessory sulfurtransferase FdhD [Methylophilus sp.]